MHAKLHADKKHGADPEDPDEYRAASVFWVPKEARWKELQKNAKQPTIGKLIDEAMIAIERDNKSLKGVLPKDYARPALDKQRLGELIDLIGTIGLGDADNRSKDILGRVYEYFLSQFASAEGKKGGQFYTPRCVVRVLVEMLAPYKGRVFDPCCGSGGMFVQSEKFVEAHGGRIGDISIYGQESNPTTCAGGHEPRDSRDRGQSRPEHADTFHRDLHKDLKADYILAIPRLTTATGAAIACVKISAGSSAPHRQERELCLGAALHPSPGPHGSGGLRVGQRSMSSNQSGEETFAGRSSKPTWSIAWSPLPGSSFTRRRFRLPLVPARQKKNGRFRDRRGETLFIDARKLGFLVNRVQRDFTDDEVARIAARITPGAATRTRASMRTWPASAKAPSLKRSLATASSLPLAGTSAPSSRRGRRTLR